MRLPLPDFFLVVASSDERSESILMSVAEG